MADPPYLDLAPPPRIALADPKPFLAALSARPWFFQRLSELDAVEMWALVAMCALSRRELADDVRSDVLGDNTSSVGRFAHAVGFSNAQVGTNIDASQPAKTVAIQRVRLGQPSAKVAREIAGLAVPGVDEEDSRDALAYVLDELLRNVLQHSGDALGAVVGAQRMDAGKGGYSRATVQIAVADTGRGILESLRRNHAISTADVAVEMALRPHISGTFAEGQTGSLDNAGLGLFFTSEMAKLTAGRFLLASRGATVFLPGDEEGGTHTIELFSPEGFPGTLAVFELPLEIKDRDALLEVIRGRASQQAPAHSRRWLSYEAPPEGLPRVLVGDLLEDTGNLPTRVESYRAAIAAGQPHVFDFAGIPVLTQSAVHALLFHSVRVGWAMGVKVYVEHASPAVRSGLDYFESYAL